MTLPPLEICQRIHKLHAMIGSSYDHEAANAFDMLKKLLAELGLTWNDLPQILPEADVSCGGVNNTANTGNEASQATNDTPAVNVLDLILTLIERHVAITAEECMVVALWVLHTYVFDQLDITPRLAVLSPASECGK